MDNYQNPKPGKTYISPSLQAFGSKERRVRIASKVLPSVDGYEYVKECDEAVLRKKPDAATHNLRKVSGRHSPSICSHRAEVLDGKWHGLTAAASLS
jgi:hypothetical protein